MYPHSTDSSQWLFPISALKCTPSATTSAITLDRELYDRARGIEFLYRLGASLQLPATSLATAATWFHRFYMRYSMEDYHRQDVAAACIFLATKTEECGRKLRDIAKVAQSKIVTMPTENISNRELDHRQEMILATEEALLEALCFDFVVDNPHQVLVDLFQTQREDFMIQEMAWSIAYDSYRTVLCILFDIRIIAAACYILAQRTIEGPHSASLNARITVPPPSSSLPTPPSHKPTSPDATRVAVEHFKFSYDESKDLAEAITIMIEFYAAQDTRASMSYLLPLSTIPPPTLTEAREKLYAPFSHSVHITASAPTNGFNKSSLPHNRTPDSSHGGTSPSKPSASRGWTSIKAEGLT